MLAYWPGVFSYDMLGQTFQIIWNQYDTKHPLLHTLLYRVFYELGQRSGCYNLGLVLMCLMQMVVTAFTMSAILRFLRKCGCPGWFVGLTLFMFAMAPFHQILVLSLTKDILFTDAFVLWALYLLEGMQHPEQVSKRKWQIGCALSTACTALLRNNGMIAMALMVPILWMVIRRNKRLCRRVLCVMLCGLVLYAGVNEGLIALVGAQAGPFQEMLCVPIQQVSRVHVLQPKESTEEVRSFLPYAAYYQPGIADPAKDVVAMEPGDLPAFLKLWLRLGVKYPVVYLDAFGHLNKGFWYLEDLSHATIKGEEPQMHEGYLGTAFREGIGPVQDSQWPALYHWYDRLYSANDYLKVPFLSVITSPALWSWMMLGLLAASLFLRRRDTLVPLLACLMVYLTYLVGPCCTVRYIYPFMFIVPLCLGALLAPDQNKGGLLP